MWATSTSSILLASLALALNVSPLLYGWLFIILMGSFPSSSFTFVWSVYRHANAFSNCQIIWCARVCLLVGFVIYFGFDWVGFTSLNTKILLKIKSGWVAFEESSIELCIVKSEINKIIDKKSIFKIIKKKLLQKWFFFNCATETPHSRFAVREMSTNIPVARSIRLHTLCLFSFDISVYKLCMTANKNNFKTLLVKTWRNLSEKKDMASGQVRVILEW